MARLKVIFSRCNTAINYTFSQRFFSNYQSNLPNWEQMTEEERISFSVNDPNPETADEAYYKGLGLLSGGEDLYEESIDAFEQAIKLSNGNHWLATLKLANIYYDLEQYQQAYKTIVDSIKKLHSNILTDNFSPEKFVPMKSSEKIGRQKYEKVNPSSPEEKTWLHDWELAQDYALHGYHKKAYEVLNSATDSLENLLRNQKISLEFLKKNLASDTEKNDQFSKLGQKHN